MDILDCTLRDGGYYTLWDFRQDVVEAYVKSINNLPVSYIEIGYRQNQANSYLGQYAYLPIYTIERIRKASNKKLAVMLNEKGVRGENLPELVAPLCNLVDTIRLAVAPENIERVAMVVEKIKDYGFEVAVNIMYMSLWCDDESFYKNLTLLNKNVDVFNMVDSYGGVTTSCVISTIKRLKNILSCKIGFHGHNNLQLALANTIAAIENGIDFVDVSIMGMGRGAGNLNTELLLTWLKGNGCAVDLNELSDVISVFLPLYEKYHWGTQLPYMISGAFSLPQKEVMELVTNRIYSFESVVQGLSDRIEQTGLDNRFKHLETEKHDNVIIIGGGPSVVEHIDAISRFVCGKESLALVFASARYASLFKSIVAHKYYCLVGREAGRLKAQHSIPFEDVCVLQPCPRKFGSDVPDFAVQRTFELPGIVFTDRYHDSCTALAIQTAANLAKGNIYVVGYDGYSSSMISDKESVLMTENSMLFEDFFKHTGNRLISITPTLYGEMEGQSVYQYL